MSTNGAWNGTSGPPINAPVGKPKYRRPSDEAVTAAIQRCVEASGIVNAQKKLRELVLTELRKVDPMFRVGGARIRRLALKTGFLRVDSRCREMPAKGKRSACPVCGARLQKSRNRTLSGGSVVIGYRCGSCGYWSGPNIRVPSRYVFALKAMGGGRKGKGLGLGLRG